MGGRNLRRATFNFVLVVGNEMNPNGGMLAVPGSDASDSDLTFHVAQRPRDTIYPTAIYTLGVRRAGRLLAYTRSTSLLDSTVAGITFVHTWVFGTSRPRRSRALLNYRRRRRLYGGHRLRIIRTENRLPAATAAWRCRSSETAG